MSMKKKSDILLHNIRRLINEYYSVQGTPLTIKSLILLEVSEILKGKVNKDPKNKYDILLEDKKTAYVLPISTPNAKDFEINKRFECDYLIVALMDGNISIEKMYIASWSSIRKIMPQEFNSKAWLVRIQLPVFIGISEKLWTQKNKGVRRRSIEKSPDDLVPSNLEDVELLTMFNEMFLKNFLSKYIKQIKSTDTNYPAYHGSLKLSDSLNLHVFTNKTKRSLDLSSRKKTIILKNHLLSGIEKNSSYKKLQQKYSYIMLPFPEADIIGGFVTSFTFDEFIDFISAKGRKFNTECVVRWDL